MEKLKECEIIYRVIVNRQSMFFKNKQAAQKVTCNATDDYSIQEIQLIDTFENKSPGSSGLVSYGDLEKHIENHLRQGTHIPEEDIEPAIRMIMISVRQEVKFGTPSVPSVDSCECLYESDCHAIEMIKSPSGKEWAIGGSCTIDRWRYCPWCGKEIHVLLSKNVGEVK